MEEKLKKLYRKFRAEFSAKTYFILTAVLFAITLIRPEFAIKSSTRPYEYQYGISHSWITFYQQTNVGQQNVFFHLFHQNLGFFCQPLTIFFDTFLVYVGYIFLVIATAGIRRKMYPERLHR